MSGAEHIGYALLWVSFGLVHSLLAGAAVKDRLHPWLGRSYRLTYNVVAAIHVALILFAGRALLGSTAVDLEWSQPIHHLFAGVQWTGALLVVVALLHYDLGRFSGLTQLLNRDTDAPANKEPLHVSGLHRYVRHPLYAGAYLCLWGRIGDEFDLATAIWASVYLAVGAHFEERRLVDLYGDDYTEYRHRVPALIPRKGRATE